MRSRRFGAARPSKTQAYSLSEIDMAYAWLALGPGLLERDAQRSCPLLYLVLADRKVEPLKS